MIKLSNGYEFEFCCASGALGFDGKGYTWEYPFRWLRLLDTKAFTIITKTLTQYPRKGNLSWWSPWTCVRSLGNNNTVNAVGLTNPGLDHWRHNIYPTIRQPIIVSIFPENIYEAQSMAYSLSHCKNIIGIELNASCPNVGQCGPVVGMVYAIKKETNLPLIVKPSHEDAVEICRLLDGKVDAFDLGQSVPWNKRYNHLSPLNRYGYDGAVSGPSITHWCRNTLINCRRVTKTPIISGGGIFDLEETKIRRELGADAIAFGTLFLYKPWAPNRIIKKWQSIVRSQ